MAVALTVCSMAMAQSGQECYEKAKECVFSNKLTEAMKWFQKAAEQGHAKAICNIGQLYELGCGVPQDQAEAEKWFRLTEESQSRFKSIGL